jgi:hypothetical protein
VRWHDIDLAGTSLSAQAANRSISSGEHSSRENRHILSIAVYAPAPLC